MDNLPEKEALLEFYVKEGDCYILKQDVEEEKYKIIAQMRSNKYEEENG
jgi:hypothetical protein